MAFCISRMQVTLISHTSSSLPSIRSWLTLDHFRMPTHTTYIPDTLQRPNSSMSRSKSRRSSSRQHKAQRTLLARNLCAGRHARALCNFIQLAPSDGPPKPTPSALGFFPMRGIINEDAKRYLIQWTRNPVTGEDFWPTWKPKGWVGVPAVRKWEELKAQRIAKFYAERITRILHVSDADKGGGSIPC
ncbi:hypothetical protein LTR66_010333 [Elasticomyces elasticus]|nr:hypothetical protein LTR66_010333 [Elasticomyces elasticus]